MPFANYLNVTPRHLPWGSYWSRRRPRVGSIITDSHRRKAGECPINERVVGWSPMPPSPTSLQAPPSDPWTTFSWIVVPRGRRMCVHPTTTSRITPRLRKPRSPMITPPTRRTYWSPSLTKIDVPRGPYDPLSGRPDDNLKQRSRRRCSWRL